MQQLLDFLTKTIPKILPSINSNNQQYLRSLLKDSYLQIRNLLPTNELLEYISLIIDTYEATILFYQSLHFKHILNNSPMSLSPRRINFQQQHFPYREEDSNTRVFIQSNNLKIFSNQETDTYTDLMEERKPDEFDKLRKQNLKEHEDIIKIFNEALKDKSLSLNRSESNASQILKEVQFYLKKSKKKNEWVNNYAVEDPAEDINMSALAKLFQQKWENMFNRSIKTTQKIYDKRMQQYENIVKQKAQLEKDLANQAVQFESQLQIKEDEIFSLQKKIKLSKINLSKRSEIGVNTDDLPNLKLFPFEIKGLPDVQINPQHIQDTDMIRPTDWIIISQQNAYKLKQNWHKAKAQIEEYIINSHKQQNEFDQQSKKTQKNNPSQQNSKTKQSIKKLVLSQIKQEKKGQNYDKEEDKSFQNKSSSQENQKNEIHQQLVSYLLEQESNTQESKVEQKNFKNQEIIGINKKYNDSIQEQELEHNQGKIQSFQIENDDQIQEQTKNQNVNKELLQKKEINQANAQLQKSQLLNQSPYKVAKSPFKLKNFNKDQQIQDQALIANADIQNNSSNLRDDRYESSMLNNLNNNNNQSHNNSQIINQNEQKDNLFQNQAIFDAQHQQLQKLNIIPILKKENTQQFSLKNRSKSLAQNIQSTIGLKMVNISTEHQTIQVEKPSLDEDELEEISRNIILEHLQYFNHAIQAENQKFPVSVLEKIKRIEFERMNVKVQNFQKIIRNLDEELRKKKFKIILKTKKSDLLSHSILKLLYQRFTKNIKNEWVTYYNDAIKELFSLTIQSVIPLNIYLNVLSMFIKIREKGEDLLTTFLCLSQTLADWNQ